MIVNGQTQTDQDRARSLLREWKGPAYTFGCDVIDAVGPYAREIGRTAALIVTDLGVDWIEGARQRVVGNLLESGVRCVSIAGAGPNAPLEDLYRISFQVSRSGADMIVALGGGSTIDAGKAAAVLNAYAPAAAAEVLNAPVSIADGIVPYFGTGLVSRLRQETGRPPLPLIAVQTASSSGAHLTKYANITDLRRRQKKLIVDEAIIPAAAVFDFNLTLSAPPVLSVDGGLDGLSHIWEVFMGTRDPGLLEKMRAVAETGLRLIISGLRLIRASPADSEGRTSLGLGTDLGAYAIMIGGTSGPHLGSFSLVDIMSHGRACALLLPYYTVLFAPVIQDQLRLMGTILARLGLLPVDMEKLAGRESALAVAQALIGFLKELDFPTTLRGAGASESDVERMLAAAKDPALKMKLQNMPIPMDADRGDVDRLMGPVLEAAYSGKLDLIPQPSELA